MYVMVLIYKDDNISNVNNSSPYVLLEAQDYCKFLSVSRCNGLRNEYSVRISLQHLHDKTSYE